MRYGILLLLISTFSFAANIKDYGYKDLFIFIKNDSPSSCYLTSRQTTHGYIATTGHNVYKILSGQEGKVIVIGEYFNPMTVLLTYDCGVDRTIILQSVKRTLPYIGDISKNKFTSSTMDATFDALYDSSAAGNMITWTIH
ncbi:MAG: hypothetical protein NXI01_00100 [Gammaproteobacteria bacterium]|nr:hypothetical protein [Gammaproteobacteria bacterium]